MLKVVKSGFFTTIQDTGRVGYRDFGVPISGAMDLYSCEFANSILGNSSHASVIEMTMVGGEFQFLTPTLIAISGGVMNPRLNSKPIKQNIAIQITSNDKLSFGKAIKGFRTYLAIKNGFKHDVVLDSQSQYKPITSNNSIRKGDVLKYDSFDGEWQESYASVKYDDSILSSHILEAYKGPEFNRLSNDQRELLLKGELKVSKLNNRMAYQLSPLIKNDIQSILTSSVLPGTIQLTPSGSLIVLMRDCQTTGGYPRVLQLTEKAVNILSQKTTENSLKIRLKE